MPVLLKLDQQRRDMSAHVVKDLVLETLPLASVVMEDDRARFIAAALAARQQIVPKLGVSAAARRANVQALIEPTEEEESLAPDCHVGTGADDPSRTARRARLMRELRREKNRLVTPVKAPKGFESHLCFSSQRSRESRTSHRPDRRLSKSLPEPLDPIGMDDHIVIGERDDLPRGVAHAGVPRQIQARPRLEDVSETGKLSNNLARLARPRGVVHY